MNARNFGLSLLLAGALSAETAVDLINGDFEKNGGWDYDKMSVITTEAVHGGKYGLRIVDDSTTAGSSCRSTAMPVTAERSYAVRFWARNPARRGAVGVYMQFFDVQNRMLNKPQNHNEIILSVPNTNNQWREYTLVGKAPEGAKTLTIWIHSFNGATGQTDFDDFRVSELSKEEELKVKSTNVAAENSPKFPALSQERIAEIAAMLPDKPAGNGPSASDRKAWQPLYELPEAADIIKRAETLIDTPPTEMLDDVYLEFTQNGNRRNFERLIGQRNSRFTTLGLAEALEYKGRFLPQLERDLESLFNYRSWVMPAHDSGLENFNQKRFYADLGCSAICRDLANIDWWLQDVLKPETRSRLRAEVQKRMIGPYQEVIRKGIVTGGHWWAVGGNNWNAVCTSNMVGTALILLDDKMERAEILAAMEKSNPIFLGGFTPDGNCSEGIGYWGYGFGHFMTMGETVLNATNGKLNIYDADPEKIAKVCAYARDIQIESGICPAFADCGVNGRPNQTTLFYIQRRFPETLLHREIVTRPISRGLTDIGLLAFTDDSKYASKAPETETFPKRSLFADAGIYIGRSNNGDPRGTFGIALKAGHNAEQHNHNDVGSFLISYKTKRYFLDPGNETYTRTTFSSQRYTREMLNSFGHPVPLVDGKLQPAGVKARGTIVKTDFTDDIDTVVIDMKEAYHQVEGLESLVRTFTYDRKNYVVTVRDDVSFKEPKTFGTALLTYDKTFERRKGEIVAYDAFGGLQANIVVTGGDWSLENREIDTINANKPHRLGINLDKPVLKAAVVITIKPVEQTDDLPGFYHEPDMTALALQMDKAVTVEAENFSKQENGAVNVEPKIGASGKAFKNWDTIGHRLTWTFDVKAAGRYAVLVRSCNAFVDGVARNVSLDGKLLNGKDDPFLFPGTGGWSNAADQWKDVWMADNGKALILNLQSGKHDFTMENIDGRGLNLDWLKIVPMK
ncbi:MAG: heparinase II/III family protein [Lentisphaeria bacterium]|nr:heparinase II/III family protein [Lentisphaeria bacterium]